MNNFDEQILVVPREKIFNHEKYAFNGFIGTGDKGYEEIIHSFHDFEVHRRGEMEEDPSYKQLISYVIIHSDNDEETLVYKRLDGGGESRLHGLLSIGVGGHMNDVADTDEVMEKLSVNAERELKEEVGLSHHELQNIEIMGLINDDNNEVGKVHIGLVLKVNVSKNEIKNMEADTLSLSWVPHSSLSSMSPFESWSELIIRDTYDR